MTFYDRCLRQGGPIPQLSETWFHVTAVSDRYDIMSAVLGRVTPCHSCLRQDVAVCQLSETGLHHNIAV